MKAMTRSRSTDAADPAEPAEPAEAPPARPPTRWGDREQRRLDILDAARTRIEGGGYLALNMRDLAAAAGVSPATLYVEAIRRHTDQLRPGCDEAEGLVPLLEHVLRDYLDLYRAYGRHFTLWSALRADADPEGAPFPRELIIELRTASLEHSRLVARAVRRTAAAEGRTVAGGEVGAAYLWSTLNGVADHLTSERRALDTFDSERLIPFTAQRLALALTDPA